MNRWYLRNSLFDRSGFDPNGGRSAKPSRHRSA